VATYENKTSKTQIGEECRILHTWNFVNFTDDLVLLGFTDSKVKTGHTCSMDSRDRKSIKHFGGKTFEKAATCKTEEMR
jgi:hypothetical protein